MVPKRAAAPCDREMALASAFVAASLAVDSASFRQRMLADLLILLVRCRDSLVLEHRCTILDIWIFFKRWYPFLVAQMWVRFWFQAQILRQSPTYTELG